MWQAFQAGFGAYVLLLVNHHAFNHHYCDRHAADINRHGRLIMVEQSGCSGLNGFRHAFGGDQREGSAEKAIGFPSRRR
jgi:hypothetical protein